MEQLYAPQNTNSGQQVITIKEARKLLGLDGKSLTDNQIVELIEILTSIANDYLQDLGSINYNGN